MRAGASGQVTDLLRAWGGGDAGAADQLIPLIYDELRALAAAVLRGERAGHSIRPTALVHEAFLRLVGPREVPWQGRTHFFALAAQTMRRVLIDQARARGAGKRGGGWQRVTLEEDAVVEAPRELDVLALNVALEELAASDANKARLVELRFFGGLGVDEAARVMGVSPATAARQWRLARAWLYRRLKETMPGRGR